MASTSAILQPDVTRAPHVAQAVLGLLALACVASAAIGMGFQRDASRTPAAIEQAEAALLGSASSHAPLPIRETPSIQMLLPQGTQPPLSTTPPSTASVRPSSSRPALPPGMQLKNPQAMEAVMAARLMREQGDMQAAIANLKTADQREPNHPEVLGEIAFTYEDMGLDSRAEPLWRQIYTMGEAAAGGYYTLAASKIGATGSPAGIPPAPQGGALPVPIYLGACRLARETVANQGERISVHVPILANPGASIDPAKIEIHVTFYESANDGARIEAVAQDKTAQSWSTMPLNWAEPGGEEAVASYHLFAPAPASADAKSFHGYTVKLYYHNKLVGEQAQPESLRHAAQKGATPAGLDNALFPK